MPASKSGILTEAEIKQRQEAPIKHGAFSKKITPEKASTLAALEDRLSTRPGIVDTQRSQTAKLVQLVDALMGYAVQQYKSGTPIERIRTINVIPRYANAAQRALRQLHDMLPDENQMLDESAILEEIRRGKNQEDEAKD